MKNREEIDRLIRKYYNGKSSAEEEVILRAFFSSKNIPDEYKTEKEMFGYFMDRTTIPEPGNDFEEKIIQKVVKSKTSGLKISKPSFRIIPYIASIAAGILILTGIWFFTSRNTKTVDTYDDPQLAYTETMRILLDISSRMNDGTKILEPVTKLNEVTMSGSEILNKSTEMVRKNLNSLDQFQKAFDLTGIDIDDKTR